ncbi:flagellar protein FlgN [Yoonia sp. F2084L]|uniref:flagellar protein FlgN n=1 Tax=Yoonia sp. F2084L TaxID=2926419 RepID=UPI001FF2EF72|nr:flagellar protein FlgN [Yoonia sp. F2084L]MCK0095788.1 flagellar protein FlgN [Yoonia sp. F2084L]
MADENTKTLDDILTQEKAALLAGNYDALPPLEKRKEQALKALTKVTTSKAALAHIHFRISENQALLAAAIDGVNAARKRIAALKDVQMGLTVYNDAGKMAVVPTGGTAIEKKA